MNTEMLDALNVLLRSTDKEKSQLAAAALLCHSQMLAQQELLRREIEDLNALRAKIAADRCKERDELLTANEALRQKYAEALKNRRRK